MKKGFTLAEVLITLGVIGIVAAMTLPVITLKTTKQETLAKLKKVYSILAQGIKHSELDNGEFSTCPKDEDIIVEDYYNKYWKPYYKKPKKCITAKACGYSRNNPWKHLNGSYYDWNVVSSESRVLFMLSDGTLIFYPLNSVNYFFVDLNGLKNPNIIGRDVFVFTILDDKGLKPACYNMSYENINKNCITDSNAGCCAAKIIADGWNFKDDYPW